MFLFSMKNFSRKMQTLFLLVCSLQSVLGRPQLPLAQGNRPWYSPNPTYTLISQIVPAGKPWPANPEDYATFSQTTSPPGFVPIWATTQKPPLPFAVLNDRLNCKTETLEKEKKPEIIPWSRPTIIFYEAAKRNSTERVAEVETTTEMKPTTTTTVVTTSAAESTTETMQVQQNQQLVPIKLPDFQLFTSAPLKPIMKVSVANLLPENMVVTMEPKQ